MITALKIVILFGIGYLIGKAIKERENNESKRSNHQD